MPSYVESVIGKGEQVLYQARVSLASYWLLIALGALFALGGIAGLLLHGTVVGLVIAALFLVPPFIAYQTTELVMTNRRIIAKFGLVSRSTIELNVSKIESIRVQQSLFGRLFDYGDIYIVGTGGSREPISRISRPLEFRRRYDEILSDQAATSKA